MTRSSREGRCENRRYLPVGEEKPQGRVRRVDWADSFSAHAQSRPPLTNGVRYRRLEKLRSGRTFCRCVDISPLTQSLCDPRAPEPSPNRRCQARCGEPSSVVKILFRTSWDRAPPRQPRTSGDGSFAGLSSDEDARSCGQGKYKPYVFCQTPQSIFQVPVLSPWTERIGPEAFSVCARPRWLGELCRWQTPRP